MQEEQASYHQITILDVDDLDFKTELVETPKILEDKGQATVDELKQLNHGTTEKPWPIQVNSLLTIE